MAKIRVLLVDDHTILREGLRRLLEAEPDIVVVGEGGDGQEAIQQVERLKPDVVLMDLAMPRLNGLEATRSILKDFPEVRVLVLTMYDNEEYVSQILQAGASGYVLKRAAATELVLAIRAVHQGEAFLYPSVTKMLIAEYLARAREGEEDRAGTLTQREREVLQLISEGHTTRDIAQLLSVSVKTVQAHRSHIMEKLNLHDRLELLRYALKKGIVHLD